MKTTGNLIPVIGHRRTKRLFLGLYCRSFSVKNNDLNTQCIRAFFKTPSPYTCRCGRGGWGLVTVDLVVVFFSHKDLKDLLTVSD